MKCPDCRTPSYKIQRVFVNFAEDDDFDYDESILAEQYEKLTIEIVEKNELISTLLETDSTNYKMLKEKVQRLLKNQAEQSETITNLQNVIQAKKEQIKSLEELVSSRKKISASKEKELRAAQGKLKDQYKIISDLSLQVNDLKIKQNDTIQDKLKALTKENSDLRKQVNDLHKKMTAITEENHRVQRAAKQKNKSVSDGRTEINRLKEQMKQLKIKSDLSEAKRKEIVATACAPLEYELDKLKKDKRFHTGKINELEVKNSFQKAEILALKQKLVSMMNSLEHGEIMSKDVAFKIFMNGMMKGVETMCENGHDSDSDCD